MNIFYQPWTLIVIGLSAELALLIGARFWPLKVRRKHLLTGPILIVLALGLDYLVTTDTEKIKAVVATVVKAAEEENAQQIIACVGPTFHSKLGESREHFALFCRKLFSQPQIEENVLRSPQIQLDKTKATARFALATKIDSRSPWAQWLLQANTVWEFRLEKQPDKTWLIVRIDFLELNGNRLDWTPNQLRKHLGG